MNSVKRGVPCDDGSSDKQLEYAEAGLAAGVADHIGEEVVAAGDIILADAQWKIASARWGLTADMTARAGSDDVEAIPAAAHGAVEAEAW
jgi:hypothetical protein